MKKIRHALRIIAAGTLVCIAVYAISAGDWLRALILSALLVLLSACAIATPPVSPAQAQEVTAQQCPSLPLPLGNNQAARDNHTLLVIEMYGRCASRGKP